jgi:hypothetical protein
MASSTEMAMIEEKPLRQSTPSVSRNSQTKVSLQSCASVTVDFSKDDHVTDKPYVLVRCGLGTLVVFFCT